MKISIWTFKLWDLLQPLCKHQLLELGWVYETTLEEEQQRDSEQPFCLLFHLFSSRENGRHFM